MKDKKYIALYKAIKNKINHGEYKSGEKLPSKRIMANITGYSLITVENAYKIQNPLYKDSAGNRAKYLFSTLLSCYI